MATSATEVGSSNRCRHSIRMEDTEREYRARFQNLPARVADTRSEWRILKDEHSSR